MSERTHFVSEATWSKDRVVTVASLIEALKEFDPEATVSLSVMGCDARLTLVRVDAPSIGRPDVVLMDHRP